MDTHGFATLRRLRGHLPQIRSLLMDEAMLLAHRELWVTEPLPHPAESIEHLDAVEQLLSRDIRVDRFGVRARLGQERISWHLSWREICRAAEASDRAHAGT